MRAAWLAGLVLLAPATAGAATPWKVDLPHSTLTFRATQAGAEFEGGFRLFTADIAFDAGDLAGSRFDVRIVTASAETKEQQRDDILKGADFFATAKYPEARYVATKFRRTATGYAADGTLTLRGVTRPVAVDFTLTPAAAGQAKLTGGAAVKRLDFGVGQGEWQSTEWVGNDVKIRFELKLNPAR
jgi:polyisoprenoid-binding protein YceI